MACKILKNYIFSFIIITFSFVFEYFIIVILDRKLIDSLRDEYVIFGEGTEKL
ncbi:MAG: hypothetical protein H0Z16_06755 [Thermodesulfobacterium sp.]|nr:hypothetical protein [Thermodesulfobacterium sp.]